MNIKRHFKSLLTRISPKVNVMFNYYFYYNRRLNLKVPRYFDEKLQWLKLNEYHKPVYTKCADKFLVRDYVKDKGLEHLLINIIGVYSSSSEIVWDDLPRSFVLKWNFGNGFNFICRDKVNFNEVDVLKQIDNWGKTKSHLIHAEMQYRDIPKKIICEEYLQGRTEDGSPEDFKVYCFNGVPTYILVCEGRERGWPNFYFFDALWNLSRINRDSIDAPLDFSIPKPEKLDVILEYAKTLSEDFDFVRVDFYIVKDKVYFGELTFSPSGGFDVHRLDSTDLLFGDLLKLTKKND